MPIPEKLNFSSVPPITTVYDLRTRAYNPQVVDTILTYASGEQVDTNSLDFFADKNTRSIVQSVVNFKSRGVRKAVVVGFVTGEKKLDPDGRIFDGVKMESRSTWFKENLNSLLHHRPPWVKEVCLVIPDFEARSDRDATPGEAARAEVEAESILGAKRKPHYVVTIDAHSHRLHLDLQRNGVQHIELTANQLFAEAIHNSGHITQDLVVAAPDIGATGRADDLSYKLAKLLGKEDIELEIINKEHNKEQVNEVTLKGLIRNIDVRGKTVIIRDDRGDTLNTVLNAARVFKNKGAQRIIIVNTHAVHSFDKKDKTASPEGTSARQKYEKAVSDGIVDAMFISDSRPLTWETENPTVHVIPIGKLLGEVAASLLNKGLAETKREFKDHFFQPKHPYAVLEDVAKRRNNKNQHPLHTVFARLQKPSPTP